MPSVEVGLGGPAAEKASVEAVRGAETTTMGGEGGGRAGDGSSAALKAATIADASS